MIRRHPLLFVWLGACSIIFAVIALMPRSPEYKKLDYLKPIYTGNLAIVCPQSLLFDLRADHDADAIFEAFTTFSQREEKAKNLGCDVVTGDIPVTAERMSSPFNNYVSVSIPGMAGAFFTMEGDLKNGIPEGSSQPSAVTSGPAAQETIESGFKRQLSSLEEPMPNLRWLPIATFNPRTDQQQDAELVTPYGPCVMMISNATRTGYVVMKSNTTEFLGSNDASRASATKTAEHYCHEWYVTEAQSSSQIDHMWFKPDPEDLPKPPAEIMTAIPERDFARPTEPSVQAPALVAPSTRPSVPEEYKWQKEPSGDKVLTGSSRPCATLENLSDHDPGKVRVTFRDGTSRDYFVSQILDATQAATDYCAKGQPGNK